MTVTEINRAIGSWTIKLHPDTPRSILRALEYFGHIAVVPGRVNVEQYGDNLLASARYVGVYRGTGKQDEYTLKGAGMAFWLGDEDDKGDAIETEINLAGETFADAIRAVLPPGGAIVEGTLHGVAGTYNGRHIYETPRSAIDYITDLFEAEWRVNGDGTLDAGTVAQLYVVDPRAILMRRQAGSDLSLRALPGAMAMDVDVEDYTTRVLLLAEGEGTTIATGEADAGVVPFKDIHGNVVKLTRLISESGTVAGNADARAQLQLNRFSGSRYAVALSSADYDVKGDFVVGDYLYVYDPEAGFVDIANEVVWEATPINPMALRCIEMTWPVRPGWTVGFRRGSDGVWVDLSDYFVPETGDTTIVVGEFNRSLTASGGEDIGNRPNTGGVDTSIPAAPTFTGFSTGSYQSATDNITRSALRVQWTTPLNIDASTIVDGGHYEIRYRVNQQVGYLTYWDDIEASYDWDDLAGNSWDALYSEPVEASPEWLTTVVGWGTNAFTLLELTPGVVYELQIRAVDSANPPHQSAWSASSFVTTVGDLIAPSIPAAPVVASSRIAIQVTHFLGKSSGGQFNLEQDLDHLEVHVGGSASFFADDSTKVGDLIGNATMLNGSIPSIGTFNIEQTDGVWVKVIAVDHAGNKSGASSGVQASALLIDNAHISDLSVSKLTAGTITAQSILAADLEVATGGHIKITDGSMQVYNTAGRLVMEIGQNSVEPQFHGVYIYNDNEAVVAPVMEIGEHRDGIGFVVNDEDYFVQIEAGKLKDGDYGFAAVNIFGQLVKFSNLVFGPSVGTDTDGGTRASTLFGDLTGSSVGPVASAVIGDTGRCMVILGCFMSYNVPAGAATATGSGYMSFDVSGPTPIAANDFYACSSVFRYNMGSGTSNPNYDVQMGASRVIFLEGLTPGEYTFTAKYRVDLGTTTFFLRDICVLPY